MIFVSPMVQKAPQLSTMNPAWLFIDQVLCSTEMSEDRLMPKPTPPLWVIVLPDTVEPSAFVRPSAVPIAEYWKVLLVIDTFLRQRKT